MKRKNAKRRAAIIAELSKMSRDWTKYTAADWKPLEDELKELRAAD